MPYKVFFSHSQRDEDWVKWIARNLTGQDIAVYLFQYDLQPGKYHAKKVQKAITECDCFVVLITRNSEQSNYVHQEIGFAEGKEKPVVPLVESGIDSLKLAMLEGREHIKFQKSRPYDAMQNVSTFLLRDKHIKERNRNIGIGVIAGLLLCSIFSGNDDSNVNELFSD